MIDEDKKKAMNAQLARQADEVAREALHFMSSEHPEEYATVCELAEQNPDWLRRLLRALYIAGYRNGQDAMSTVLNAANESKNETLN